MKIFRKTLSLFLALLCLSSEAFAKEKSIIAFNFYQSDQIYNYCNPTDNPGFGAGWEYKNIHEYIWQDINKEEYLCRSSTGLQYDFYDDDKEALLKEILESSFAESSGLVMEGKSEYDTYESDYGDMGGNIPDYSSYVNEANQFVHLAKEQCGTSETPVDLIRYTRELGFADGKPWSATFVYWVADQCKLTSGSAEESDYNIFGDVSLSCNDMYSYLTATKKFDSYACSEIEQLTGGEYKAVPGDIVFWKGKDDTEFTKVGIVTDTNGNQDTRKYIVITQGNTASGHVLPLLYSEVTSELAAGEIVHVEYPNSVFNGDTIAIVIGFLREQQFSDAAIYGVLANMDAESGLIPYRCEGDFSDGYAYSVDYTKRVDSGALSGAAFETEGLSGCGKGYGLVQFTYHVYKRSLFDLAKKRGTSIGDAETQMIALMDMWRGEIISYYKASERNDNLTKDFLTSIGIDKDETTCTYDLLKQIPNTQEGCRIACNIILTYYEKPINPNLEDRMARGAKYSAELVIS